MKSMTTGRSLIPRLRDDVVDVLLTLHAEGDAAQRLGQLHEVRMIREWVARSVLEYRWS